jgi:HPt (histidine-containing phosphotransfer) domain-containing protein
MQPTGEPVWDLIGGLKDLFLEGDTEIVGEILELYLSDSAALLAEILVAREQGQFDQMAALLHKMKGSALQAGALRLAAQVKAAELAARAGDFTAPAYGAAMASLRAEWELGAALIRIWLSQNPH